MADVHSSIDQYVSNETSETSEVKKKKGPQNQAALYSKIASHADEILTTLFEALKSGNENVRLGAAKVLINKILPDLKSTEVHGGVNDDGTRRQIELFVNLGGGFVPSNITLPSSSIGSTTAASTMSKENLEEAKDA